MQACSAETYREANFWGKRGVILWASDQSQPKILGVFLTPINIHMLHMLEGEEQ